MKSQRAHGRSDTTVPPVADLEVGGVEAGVVAPVDVLQFVQRVDAQLEAWPVRQLLQPVRRPVTACSNMQGRNDMQSACAYVFFQQNCDLRNSVYRINSNSKKVHVDTWWICDDI